MNPSEKRHRSCEGVPNSESQQVLEALNAKKVFWLAKARASPGQPRRPWTRTRARRTCRLSPPGAAGSPLTPTRPPTFGRSVLGWTGAQIIIRKLMDTSIQVHYSGIVYCFHFDRISTPFSDRRFSGDPLAAPGVDEGTPRLDSSLPKLMRRKRPSPRIPLRR